METARGISSEQEGLSSHPHCTPQDLLGALQHQLYFFTKTLIRAASELITHEDKIGVKEKEREKWDRMRLQKAGGAQHPMHKLKTL